MSNVNIAHLKNLCLNQKSNIKGKTMVNEKVTIERALKDARSLAAGVPIICPYCGEVINDKVELNEHDCKGNEQFSRR